jgi:hypothetical protein
MRLSLNLFFFGTLLTAAFSSCSLTQKTTSTDYDYIKITKQGIIQKPLIADLDVSKDKKSLTKTYQNTTLGNAKEVIMGDFIKEFNCDLIVNPFFTSTTTSKTEKISITLTVTGYPASYKNIRNFEAKDTLNFVPKNVTLLNSGTIQLSNPNDLPFLKKKKSPAGWIVGGSILAGALAFFILISSL